MKSLGKILLYMILMLVFLESAGQQKTTKMSKIRAYYRLTYQIDSTNSNYINTSDMVLYIGDGISKFGSVNRLFIEDSLSAVIQERAERTGHIDLSAMQVPHTIFKWKVFNSDAGMIVFDHLMAQEYRYVEKDANISWKLEAETKEIAGYNCQKASGHFAGRSYTAWFTKEIPVSEGPYKFKGLPGLILKIYDAERHYDFELIKLEKHTDYDLSKQPERFVKTSKKELFQLIDAKRNNPVESLAALGGVDLSEEEEEEIINRNKMMNNPIELVY